MAMLAVRLDEQTERRPEALAARTGRTKTFYAREAIAVQLEDFYLAEERVRAFCDRGVRRPMISIPPRITTPVRT